MARRSTDSELTGYRDHSPRILCQKAEKTSEKPLMGLAGIAGAPSTELELLDGAAIMELKFDAN